MIDHLHQILIIFPPTNRNYGLFDDLISDKRVILRCATPRSLNRYASIIKKIHLSKWTNKIYDLPFKEKWYEYYDVLNLLPNLKYILVIDLALNSPGLPEMLEKCHMKSDCKIGLFYINSLDTVLSENRYKLKKTIELAHKMHWDDIYSFDPCDVNKFGFTYMGFNYYSMKKMAPVNISSDLYCVGIASKDREKMFLDIYNYLTNRGCNCDFYLKMSPYASTNIDGIHIVNKWKDYSTVLKELQSSRCILEIIRDNQHGPSLRYFEAVCYNKKLLTNNKEIVHYPFYDNKYMRFFTKLEDIDVDWLKDTSSVVDYHYNGDFSPSKMVDFLLKTHS